MTEAEWLECEDPLALWAFVAARATDRKRQLFLCACCARVLAGTPPRRRSFRGHYPGCFQQLEYALGVAERFSDGAASPGALAKARRDADDSVYVPASIDFGGESGLDREAEAVALAAAEHPVVEDVIASCLRATESQSDGTTNGEDGLRIAEARWQAMVLRDVFGNPFLPPAFSPDWRPPAARHLAAVMYHSRDFSSMPNLANALREAGCEAADILAHCSGPGPHVRGCWVVDLVLGKS